jgi:hypothetical protein
LEKVERPAAPPVTAPPPPASSRPDPSAAGPEPRVASPSSPALEESAIQQTLDAYRTAYEGLNVGAVRAIMPLSGEQASQLAKSFDQLEWYRMAIDNVRVNLDGSKATVACSITRNFKGKVGRPVSRTDRTVFRLQKKGASWLISGVDAK